MNLSFLYKWGLVLGLLLGHVLAVFAQDANVDRAKHIYELFITDQADSIHALLSAELREKMSPEAFKGRKRVHRALRSITPICSLSVTASASCCRSMLTAE